jgi:phosphoglucosamine mutase
MKEEADIGIAFDGDGDRVVMVDHLGNVVDGDGILFVIASDMRRQNVDFGGVVGTSMSNLGLEQALDFLDIPFARSAVGDRYVMRELLERGWGLGGESSGHIICLDKTTTGDGIVSALQALSAISRAERSLAELTSKLVKYPQSMVNVLIADSADIAGSSAVQNAIADVESKLGSKGRVLLRPSGTEPVVRVMVEGEDATEVLKLAQELAEVVEKEIGAAA